MMWRAPPAPIRSRMPPCSGQSRPSPSGGREDAASLDRPCARRLRDLAGRDGRMLAARVEPKNGPQENKKTGNFKPLVLSQFQAAVDTAAMVPPPSPPAP